MNLDLFIDLERGPRSDLIRWLQRQRLIADPLLCAQCNIAMDLIERNDNHGWFSLVSLIVPFT